MNVEDIAEAPKSEEIRLGKNLVEQSLYKNCNGEGRAEELLNTRIQGAIRRTGIRSRFYLGSRYECHQKPFDGLLAEEWPYVVLLEGIEDRSRVGAARLRGRGPTGSTSQSCLFQLVFSAVRNKDDKDGLRKDKKFTWHFVRNSALNCTVHSNCNSLPGASALAFAKHAKLLAARDSSVGNTGKPLPAKTVSLMMRWNFGHEAPNRMKVYRILKQLKEGDGNMGGSLIPLSTGSENFEIGFIGLDMEAKKLATSLFSVAGRRLKVWDRSPDICEEFAKENEGCSVSSTPKEVVESCSIIYVALPDVESSISVYAGPCGIIVLPSLTGKKLIECSRYTPERMIEVESIVTAKGGIFLEAAALGSNVPADGKKRIFLCGGSRMLYDEVATDLDAMGKASHFFGNTGEGTKVRMVANMVMGSMVNALGEGLILASKCRLLLNEILEVLNDGICVSDMIRALERSNSSSVANSYGQDFFTEHQLADMRHAIGLQDPVGFALPVAVAAYQQLKRLKSADEDATFD